MVSEKQTLTEILMPNVDPCYLRQLERHRQRYEQQHGPTDLTQRYTSMLPVKAQQQLMDQNPEQYVLGWRPYIQDFLRLKLQRKYASRGALDQAPEHSIRVYCAIVKGDGRSR